MSPTDPSSPSRSAISGPRKSASTTSTRLPAAAIAIARLHTEVVLPSPGSALVTTMTLHGLSTSTYCRFVRNCRNASARGDCGASCTVSGCFGILAS